MSLSCHPEPQRSIPVPNATDPSLRLRVTRKGPLSYYPDYFVKRHNQNKYKKGAQVCRLRPSYVFGVLHFCLSEFCLCACRGQRHLTGCHNKHPIGANKHGHRHIRCGGCVLMFHLLELSSSFRALPRNYKVRNSAITLSMPTITGSIAICQA